MGITAEEIAAHLGMSTEDLLSEDFDFPLDVHPLHIESAIRKVHTKRIGAGFYTTRMGGRTYTIGGKVTVKVYPADDQHWHEDDDWDTTVEAIVYKIEDNEVQLMPVISYEPGNLNLMDIEESGSLDRTASVATRSASSRTATFITSAPEPSESSEQKSRVSRTSRLLMSSATAASPACTTSRTSLRRWNGDVCTP